MAMQAGTATYENVVHFDTYSARVGIDNRCTGCISHMAQDFVAPLRDSGRTIKGFGRTKTGNVGKGTRPKHKYGTISQTTSDHVVLMWNDQKSHLTVPLTTDSNVATFHLATGYVRYDDFCIQAQLDDNTFIPSEEVPMCKTIAEATEIGIWGKDLHGKFLQGPDQYKDKLIEKKDPTCLDLGFDKNDEFKLKQTEQDPSMGLLKLHQRFGHISFKKLQYGWLSKVSYLNHTLHATFQYVLLVHMVK